MQCGFCHQQGSEYTRADRTAEDWSTTIKRMVRYGSRLPSEQQKALPEILVNAYKSLQLNPESITPPNPWEEHLQHTKIMQWDIGNSMSQTHDLLVVPNQPLISNTTVYVADNIQDRLYEIILPENKVTIYKIPHLNTDQPGGLISARLRDFPQHDSTSNAHSLARSLVDGHIFITPSAQQRLIEFDPAKKNFKIHQMTRGFYPHTIRIDKQDRVWFTLALSNQVAMYDRLKNTFTYYDLPARSFSEKIITKNIYWIFKLMSWGLPISNWLPISKDYNGTPLVYGIDTDSNNLIWFARLHTNEIGFINPSTHLIQLIKTPFTGPRRLRADKNGNIWITSFGDSLIAKYDISSKKFTLYPMPVKPSGSETPYSVNIDHDRHLVWVTGNQSNAIYSFNVVSEKWKTYPLPRNITFTRDIELDTEGNAYAANSNFPSWQIEDGQPSMIKIMPTINK
jgi:streptogramin lyase